MAATKTYHNTKKVGSDLSGGLPENHIHNLKFDKNWPYLDHV